MKEVEPGWRVEGIDQERQVSCAKAVEVGEGKSVREPASACVQGRHLQHVSCGREDLR